MNVGHWSFDKALIVLVSPMTADQIGELVFRIHNLLVNYMSRNMAWKLETMVGKVEEIVYDDCSRWTYPFMKIQVKMDNMQPLQDIKDK